MFADTTALRAPPMPRPNVYHVVPVDGRWGVRLEGSPTLSHESDDRDDAVDQAASYVRRWGAGRIVVHGDSGQIETVHTFDQLPVSRPSWRDTVLSGPAVAVGVVVLLVAFGVGLARR